MIRPLSLDSAGSLTRELHIRPGVLASRSSFDPLALCTKRRTVLLPRSTDSGRDALQYLHEALRLPRSSGIDVLARTTRSGFFNVQPLLPGINMKLVWWRCGEGDWCLAYVAWIPLLRCLESASEASLPVNGHSTERIQSSAGVPCVSSHSSTRTVFVCMQDATTNTGGLGPMCGMGHGCCGTEVARCAGPALALGARGFEKGTSKKLESRPLNLSHACQRPRPFPSRLDRWSYRI